MNESKQFDKFKLDHLYNPIRDVKVVKAQQCILTPCLRDYKVSTVKGVPNIQTTSVNYGITDYIWLYGQKSYPNQADATSCWQPDRTNVTYSFVGQMDDKVYRCKMLGECDLWANQTSYAFCPVDNYARQIGSYLRGSSLSRYAFSWGGDPYMIHDWTATEPEYSSDIIRRVASHNLSYVMGNLAASLTDHALSLADETVPGLVKTSEVYVFVRWEWLILPICLEIVGFVLFITTVLRTHTS